MSKIIILGNKTLQGTAEEAIVKTKINLHSKLPIIGIFCMFFALVNRTPDITCHHFVTQQFVLILQQKYALCQPEVKVN